MEESEAIDRSLRGTPVKRAAEATPSASGAPKAPPHVQLPSHEISKATHDGTQLGMKVGGKIGSFTGVASVTILFACAGEIGAFIGEPLAEVAGMAGKFGGEAAGAGVGAAGGAAVGCTKKLINKVRLHSLKDQIKDQQEVNGQVALCGVRQTSGKPEKSKLLGDWKDCQTHGDFSCAAPANGDQGGQYSYSGSDKATESKCRSSCACILSTCLQGGKTCTTV